jgi:hypothetical protein
MGSLMLPATGRIYVDAQVFIYSVQKHPDYAALLVSLWGYVERGRCEVISSELTLMEVLVGPLKRGDKALADDFEAMLAKPGVQLVTISQEVLRKAAILRAHSGEERQ